MLDKLELLRPEELVHGDHERIGVYGLNGAGKSSFLASYPAKNGDGVPSLLVASADRENVRPYAGHAHIRIVKLRSWDDLAALLRFCQAGCANRDKTGKPFFTGLGFDTWTRIQALEIAKKAGFKPPEPGQEAAFIDRAPGQPRGYDAWNEVGALAAQWMSYFNELPMDVCYLFQEQGREDERRPEGFTVGPALTALADRATRDALNVFGRLYVALETDTVDLLTPTDGNGKAAPTIDPDAKEARWMLLGQHGPYFAKGPTHALGHAVRNPTWQKIAAARVQPLTIPED